MPQFHTPTHTHIVIDNEYAGIKEKQTLFNYYLRHSLKVVKTDFTQYYCCRGETLV